VPGSPSPCRPAAPDPHGPVKFWVNPHSKWSVFAPVFGMPNPEGTMADRYPSLHLAGGRTAIWQSLFVFCLFEVPREHNEGKGAEIDGAVRRPSLPPTARWRAQARGSMHALRYTWLSRATSIPTGQRAVSGVAG
jgi:hypothetical protein